MWTYLLFAGGLDFFVLCVLKFVIFFNHSQCLIGFRLGKRRPHGTFINK